MNFAKSRGNSPHRTRRRSPFSNIGSMNSPSSRTYAACIVCLYMLLNIHALAWSFRIKSLARRQNHGINFEQQNNYRTHLFSSYDPSTTSSSATGTTTDSGASMNHQTLGAPICIYHQVDVPSSETNPVPRQAISVEDLTPTLNRLLEESGMVNGLLTVISRHTTTSLTINEWESRLAEDIADSLLKLVPPDERSISPASQKDVTYKHNDIDVRPFGDDSDYNVNSEEAQRCRENGWDVDDLERLQAWRDQEPINAHSHLLSILAGSGSESIPVVDGKMVLGQWQSVLLLDLDGPRDRTVGVQLMGYT